VGGSEYIVEEVVDFWPANAGKHAFAFQNILILQCQSNRNIQPPIGQAYGPDQLVGSTSCGAKSSDENIGVEHNVTRHRLCSERLLAVRLYATPASASSAGTDCTL
jgi:hypothetical protein